MDEQMSNDSSATDSSIDQLLADFKSSLSRRNINFKGKLTITIGEASGVEIKFQPHPNTPQIECLKSTSGQHTSSPYDVSESFHSSTEQQVKNTNTVASLNSDVEGSVSSFPKSRSSDAYSQRVSATDSSVGISHNVDVGSLQHFKIDGQGVTTPVCHSEQNLMSEENCVMGVSIPTSAVILPPIENIMQEQTFSPLRSMTQLKARKAFLPPLKSISEQSQNSSASGHHTFSDDMKPCSMTYPRSSNLVEKDDAGNMQINSSNENSSNCAFDLDISISEGSNVKNEFTDVAVSGYTQLKLNNAYDLKHSKPSRDELQRMSHEELVAMLTQVMENLDSRGNTKQVPADNKRTSTLFHNDKTGNNGGKHGVPQPAKSCKKECAVFPKDARHKKKSLHSEETNSAIVIESSQVYNLRGKTKRCSTGRKRYVTVRKDKLVERQVKKPTADAQKETKIPKDTRIILHPLKKRRKLWGQVKDEETTKDASFQRQYDGNSDNFVEKEQKKMEGLKLNELSSQPVENRKVTRPVGKKTSFSCKECSEVFFNKLKYRQHIRSHSSGFQCDICGKTLKTKDSLYHHQRGLHTKDKPYQCKECNVTFNFHHSYKLHLQRHKGERPFECDICHKTYLTSNHLKVHVEASHGIGSIACHICNKKFSYASSLKLHIYTHTGEKPYKCEKCNKRFSTRQSLQIHSSSHFDGKNYPCEICGKFYKSEHSKNIHVKRHKNQIKRFMCDMCGKTFLFKSTLKAHAGIHSKMRPYTCPLCGKSFKSKASLYTHKYVHRESSSFICSICGKSFKTKNCRVAHMKRHENDESHVCATCGSTFPDKGGLTKHIKTIHLPKKHFTCTICGKKGTRADNMRTHIRSHRNEVSADTDPKDFILEEMLSEGDSSQVSLNVRPRIRNPRHKSSRKLCVSSNIILENDDISPRKDAKFLLDNLPSTVKADCTSVSVTNSSLLTLPNLEPQQYPQPNFLMSSLNENEYGHPSHSSQTVSFSYPSQQKHFQQPSLHADHSKASSYLTHIYQHDLPGSNCCPSSVNMGVMTNLLSSVVTSSDHDSVGNDQISSSIPHNSLASLHPTLQASLANQRMLSGLYTDQLPAQVSLSQAHQVRPNTMQGTILLNHEHPLTQLHETYQVNYVGPSDTSV